MAIWALLVGLNYQGTPYALKGCINDAMNTREMLMKKFKVPASNITVMTDESKNGSNYPEPDNVKREFKRIIAKAQPKDTLYFHFSGHGFNIKGGNVMTTSGGKIKPGLTECILVRDKQNDGKDIDRRNTICDSQFNDLFAMVPANMKVFALIDACNSGTVFELTHNVRMMSTRTCKDFCVIPKDSEINYYLTHNDHRPCYRANIVILSSVKTKQVAWDTTDKNGKPAGALTGLYIDLVSRSTDLSPLDLLYKLDLALQPKYKQDPCLSFCNINLINQPFI